MLHVAGELLLSIVWELPLDVKKTKILYGYVLTETLGTWATSTIAYMTWILITRENASADIAFIWLALPALIALITTPPFACRVELTSQRGKVFCSLILRVLGLILMALLLGGVSQHLSIEVIVALGLMIGFVSVLDAVIHAPIPFLLAN